VETAGLHQAAARLAKRNGVSLNQWIATAVAQKIGVVETAAEFLRRRAGDARPQELKALLAEAPDVPTERGDEVPGRVARGWGECIAIAASDLNGCAFRSG
jgi:hypothetical protein